MSRNKNNKYKLLMIISVIFLITIVSYLIVYTFFVSSVELVPVGKDLEKEHWLNFTGAFLGAVIGGIIAVIGVYYTIKSNRTLLENQMKLQFKPILFSITTNEFIKLDKHNTIMFSIDFSTYSNEFNLFSHDFGTNNVDKLNECLLSLVNNGNGTAYNISLSLKKVKSIEGLENPIKINNDPNVYDKSILVDYNSGVQWKLYYDFSLAKSQKIIFVFRCTPTEDKVSMLLIEYEDCMGNAYIQKCLLVNYSNKTKVLPISKIYTKTTS